jgi:hypothetical protein
LSVFNYHVLASGHCETGRKAGLNPPLRSVVALFAGPHIGIGRLQVSPVSLALTN